MPGKESKLQTRIKLSMERSGWLVTKIMLSSRPGWPDLACIRNGVVVWIETKAPGEKLRPLQDYVHHVIKGHGGIVLTINSWDEYKKSDILH